VSGPAAPFDALGFVRRVLVVALLSVGMVLLHQYAVPGDGFDPRAMLALGFLILAAFTIGELATTVRIPHITGYLLAGVLFGPSLPEMIARLAPWIRVPPPLDAGIVSRGVLGQLGPIDALALALIALSAGGELEFDELRRSFRYVLGSTLGMVFTTIVAVFVFLATAVAVAPTLLPEFSALSTEAALVLCLLVGTLAAATSPAVSIAVVHSTGARGPVASAVLTGVVVGEIVLVVLFSATTTLALPILGGVGTVTVAQSVLRVVASVGIGFATGAVLTTYLRLVAVDLLLFLVSAVFLTTWLVNSIGGEPAVAFIAAGLVVGNAHRVVHAAGPDTGRLLLVNVERMSRPVFAVFFALAGAKLHLDVLAQLAVPALAIFVVRGVAVRLGTTTGARLSGAPAMVEKYAWTGFVSQAGLAIALASQARSVLPENVRDAVYSLALAVVAVAEIVGPSVLQAGLRAAGEIPEAGPSARPAPERNPPPNVGTKRWPVPEPVPWPVVPSLGDAPAEQALAALDEGLQRLVEQEVGAPIEGVRRDGEAWVRQMRQHWNRQVRPDRWAHLEDQELGAALRDSLADGLASAIEQVRAFDPVADTNRSPFVATALVERIDRLVAALPSSRPVPVPDSVLAARPEPFGDRLRRAMLRFGVRTFGARRSMSLRDLGRYHLSGGVPASLEAVLAIGPHARCHLADRTSEIYLALSQALQTRAAEAESGVPADVVCASLAADFRAVENTYRTLLAELDAFSADATECARAALGGLADRLYADAERAGTFELGSRGPRYRPRFRERTLANGRLTVAVANGRAMVRSRLDELLLQLELASLENRVDGAARTEGRNLDTRFGRQVVAGLAQLDLDVERWLALADTMLAEPTTHDGLVRTLRASWNEVYGDIAAAVSGLRSMSELVAGQTWSSPIVAALHDGLDNMSATHLLGVQRGSHDRRHLPDGLTVTSVATARRAATMVESRLVQPLRELGDDLTRELTEALTAATELERVTQFNVDLAVAELDLLPANEVVSDERREQLRSMLVAAPSRTRHRLRQRQEALLARDGTIRAAIEGVLDGLGRFEQELRLGGPGAPADQSWLHALPAQLGSLQEQLRAGIGEDRLLHWRRAAGLTVPVPPAELVAAFRPPAWRIAIPQSYTRLFSDLPFETGDLVAGRQVELGAVRTALSSGLRSAAIVGIDPHGARALVTAALGAGRAPSWFDADGPTGPGTVARWLEPHAHRTGQVFVIENLRWLFRRAPGGFSEIEALAGYILRDGGRNQWLLVADGGVWRYLAAATSIRDAMGAAVELTPLTVEELARAIESRHAMSGYGLHFQQQTDFAYRARRAFTRGSEEERSRLAWFRTLHDASGGVLQDAMRLWLASITSVDEAGEQVVLGAVPRPPTASLQQLDDSVLLTLLETRRQGWIDEDGWSRLFRQPPHASQTHLAQLRHLGLLVPHGASSKLAPHLRGPIEQVLTARGWT
jgi:Kef-type K+ transport system membrane component KefB